MHLCTERNNEYAYTYIYIYIRFLFGKHAVCIRLTHNTFPKSQFSSTSTQVLSVLGRVCLHSTLLGKACHGISRYFGRAHGTDLADFTTNSQQQAQSSCNAFSGILDQFGPTGPKKTMRRQFWQLQPYPPRPER